MLQPMALGVTTGLAVILATNPNPFKHGGSFLGVSSGLPRQATKARILAGYGGKIAVSSRIQVEFKTCGFGAAADVYSMGLSNTKERSSTWEIDSDRLRNNVHGLDQLPPSPSRSMVHFYSFTYRFVH